MINRNKKHILLLFSLALLVMPGFTRALSVGDGENFFVDSSYDIQGRIRMPMTLQRVGSKALFYTENDYWRQLDSKEKNAAQSALVNLDNRFREVFVQITSLYGLEPRPGIDNESRVYVAFHSMGEEIGGYFRTLDQKYTGNSNKKDIVYLNIDHLTSELAPSYLVHEFTHLITYNQKNKLRDVSEERWLNELRAEYTPTLAGFDDDFENSNLKNRKEDFLNFPTTSLTEWKNEKGDYGIVNIFAQYLAEKYGVQVLTSSLKSDKTGIESLEQALERNGHDIEFSQVFLDFLIAVYANDCSLGSQYCFKNENLKDLTVAPQVNFLPVQGSSSLAVSQRVKNWAGNWYKFTGGRKGALRVQFIGNPDNEFLVAYLVRDFTGRYSLNFMELESDQRGRILVPGLGTDVSSVTIIPIAVTKRSGFTSNEQEVPFFFEATTITEPEELEKETNGEGVSDYIQRPISEMSRGEVLAKIEELEELLSQLRSHLAVLDEQEESGEDIAGADQEKETEKIEISCGEIASDLRTGMNNEEITCLQEFLKNQGQEIYPEGLVTGYFGPLTRQAVIRFQEKYKEEVLGPWDLEQGTGFVGETTRNKINQLI